MPVKDYRHDLLTRLSNPDYAAHYLKAAFDEMLSDGNRDAFLLALKNILEARETAQARSNGADISTHHLQTLLNESENPTLETLILVLHTVGLTMEFKPTTAQT